ncbi:MAG: penicillin-binding transpeptidase domain-containing protein [Acidimicrobiia bacterium]|nr:penicillin-binding transpeptidase domain-containing protein [Acidimicrobiia bacterium]
MEDTSRLRMRVLGVIAVSLFLALFGRLWYLQALESEQLEVSAVSNITRTIRTQAPRGQILDRNGRVLVENRLSTVVTINQDEHVKALIRLGFDSRDARTEFRTEMFADLARELSQSGQLTKVADLERAFADQSFTAFDDIPIARDVDEELLIFIGERPDRFPGVQVEQDVVRSYPFGEAAAHILGYVGSITGGELAEKADLYLIDDPDADDPEAPRIEDPAGKQYRRNDEIGKVGIEAFFEDDLRGVPGSREILVDNVGNLVEVNEDATTEPVQGSDVHLTLDIDLQVKLEFELKRALDLARQVEVLQDEEPFRAPAGAAVIMDPRDGSVLAMASYPTYDPGDFIDGISQEQFDKLSDPLEHQPLLNRAVSEIYPAASTFKPFTSIAAEVYNVFGWQHVEEWNVPTSDPGFWDLVSCNNDYTGDVAGALASGCRKRNAGDASMEGVDLRHAITFSSDTYYYKIGEAFWIAPDSEINPNGIQETAQQFGFGAETGIQLPGERGGIMLTAEDFAARHDANPEAFPRGQWGPGDNTDIAIGQGSVAVTPLQLANAYSTLANGGTVYSPNIVTKVVPPTDDAEPIEFGPRVLRELDLPQPVTQEIIDGLLGVTMQEKRDLTQPSGTGFDAFNKPEEGGIAFDLINWPVAGKTGTAEVTGRADNSMFAGFGPSGSEAWPGSVNEPEYTIAVILEESGFGSKHAAPMVARLFDAISTDQVPRALPQDEVDEIYDADAPIEPLVDVAAATEAEQ